MSSAPSISMATNAFCRTSQDDFQLTFDDILYVGHRDVNKFCEHDEVIDVILALTTKRSKLRLTQRSVYVPPQSYKPVHASITIDNVSFTHAKTGAIILETSVRDVTYCCSGPEKTQYQSYFAIVTANRIGSMMVGFVCHVFKADTPSSAEAVVNSFGQIFKYMVDSYSFHSGDVSRQSRHSLSSHDSRDDKDSAVATSHESLNKLGSTHSNSPRGIRKDGAGATPRSPLGSPRVSSGKVASSRRGHRRIHSDGAVDVPRLIPESANVVVAKTGDTVSATYLLEQTAQNLYRRMHRATPPIVKPHNDSRGTVHAMCFTGKDIISWMVDERDCNNRRDARSILQAMLDIGIIERLTDSSAEFKDTSKALYRFGRDGRQRSASMVAGSLSPARSSPGRSAALPAAGPIEEAAELGLQELGAAPPNIQAALEADDADRLKLSLSQDANFTPAELTLFLHRASARGSPRCIDALVSLGADVNGSLGESGNTPLHIAALVSGVRATNALLQANAQINARNKLGQTPLLLAAGKPENLELMLLMLERGAQVYAADNSGKRPIDLLPDLAEAQRRMCDAAIKRFENKASLEDIHHLCRLASNHEVHGMLFERVTQRVVNGLRDLCNELTIASDIVVEFLDTVFISQGEEEGSVAASAENSINLSASAPGSLGASQEAVGADPGSSSSFSNEASLERAAASGRDEKSRMVDLDVLPGLIAFLGIGGAVRAHCIKLLKHTVDVSYRLTGMDLLATLAQCPLQPLVDVLLDENETSGTLLLCGEFLAILVRYPSARKYMLKHVDLTTLANGVVAVMERASKHKMQGSTGYHYAAATIMETLGTIMPDIDGLCPSSPTRMSSSSVSASASSPVDTESTNSLISVKSDIARSIVAILEPLVKHESFPVRFQAGRALVLTGKHEALQGFKLFRTPSMFASARDCVKSSSVRGRRGSRKGPSLVNAATGADRKTDDLDVQPPNTQLQELDQSSTSASSPARRATVSSPRKPASSPKFRSRLSSESIMVSSSPGRHSRPSLPFPVASNPAEGQSKDARSSPLPAQRSAAGITCEHAAWKQTRGASLERAVEIMTDVSDPAVEPCRFTFLAYRAYHTPFALLRLLVHRFDCVLPPKETGIDAGTVHPVHERVLQLLELWVESALGDFLESEMLLTEMQEFLLRVSQTSPAYGRAANSLLNKVVHTSINDYMGSTSYRSALHNRLYKRARNAVLSGDVPMSRDMAATLAALQIHIADMGRQGATFFPTNVHDTMPAVRLKSVLPKAFSKGREAKAVLAHIRHEYGKICHMSVRDAKHAYIQVFQLTCSHDCKYFATKQLYGDSKRKAGRTLGIAPSRIILLDDKTKELVASHARNRLERVEWRRQKEKGSFLGKPTRGGNCLAFIFHTSPSEIEELLIGGEEATLKHILDTLRNLPTTADPIGDEGDDSGDESDDDIKGDFDPLMDDQADDDDVGDPVLNDSTSDLDYRLFMPRKDTGALFPSHSNTPTTGSPHGSKPGSKHTSPASTLNRPVEELRAATDVQNGQDTFEFGTSEVDSICDCPPTPSIDATLDLNHLTVLQLLRFPREVARQLTLLDQRIFANVTAQECLQRIWIKKLPLAPERPNMLDAIVQRFNKVSSWTATVIVDTSDLETRCWVIQQFIAIASELRALKNFHGVMAIVSALAMTPVRRLTETWDMLDAESMTKYAALEALMHAEDNFKAYRAAVARSSPPSIPYFGMVLRDLTFSQEGNPDFVRGGLMNIYKLRQMLGIIASLKRMQSKQFNFILIPEVNEFLSGIDGDDEDRLFKKSKMVQPPQMRKVPSLSKFWGGSSERRKASRRTSSHNLGFRRPPISNVTHDSS